MLRLIAHFVISLIFGYLYRGVGNKASDVLSNMVFVYGTNLFLVYTGQMAVIVSCKYDMVTIDITWRFVIILLAKKKLSKNKFYSPTSDHKTYFICNRVCIRKKYCFVRLRLHAQFRWSTRY